MINTTDRAYQLVEETGTNMHAFCKNNSISYTTISDHRRRGTKIGLATVEQVCNALSITEEEFFKEGSGG